LDLLKEVNLIVWDEFPSNHRELFEAVYKALNCFENKVVVCFGDFRQIAPVVPNGTRMQIVQASIISSFLWNKFQVRHLTQNLRLIGLSDTTRDTLLTDGEREFLENQKAYADMITKIGEGRWKGSNYIAENKAQGTQTILLPNVTCITDQRAAITFIYPNNFNTYNFAKRGILAGTNQEVDQWNTLIQALNPQFDSKRQHLLSADVLAEVDDPHGFLQELLTTETLNKFNKVGVPPHDLLLCPGDICIILRNLSKKDAITNNTRVRIISISRFCIQVQTLGSNPKRAAIPRIKFKFRLPFGQSYQLRRTQFPIRLAYCMSFNKSQGQEMDSVLLDLRNPVFTHGHLYVALSRVRDASKVAILPTKIR